MKIGSYGYTSGDPNRGKAPWTIYHNPRCSKSREAIDLLRANGIDPQIVEYLERPLKKADLENLLSILKVEPKEIIRTKEKVFAEHPIALTDKDAILEAIATHPILLERPIVVHGGKGVIARPAEKVLDLLN